MVVSNSAGSVTSNAVLLKVVPTVSAWVADSWAAEPGTDTGRFQVNRTGSTASALTVWYTAGGAATNGSDYQALSGSVLIPAGSSSAYVYLTPLDDTLVEAKETLTFALADNASYRLGSGISGTLTLLDNELPVITAYTNDSWVAEPGTDTAGFTLYRSGVTTGPLKANYTLSGTALYGADYAALGGSVTFAAGTSSASVLVTPLNDLLVEGRETIAWQVAEGVGYQTGSALSGCHPF